MVHCLCTAKHSADKQREEGKEREERERERASEKENRRERAGKRGSLLLSRRDEGKGEKKKKEVTR